MDESMASARALRTTSLLVAVTGAVLSCAGVGLAGWPAPVAKLLGAATDAQGLVRVTGIVAVSVGAAALAAAVVMMRLAHRIVRESVAVRKLARQMVAEATARTEQNRRLEVPAWATRTRPAPGASDPSERHEPAQPPPERADAEESPAERTDTWAAIDAMRSGERDKRRKSA